MSFETDIRIERDHARYDELYAAYVQSGKSQFNYAQYVWMPLQDNDQLVFVRVRGMSNIDEFYGGPTTFSR